MKTFQVLPNDPRLTELSAEQLDFVLLSMKEDSEELERAQSGRTLESKYVDEEMSNIEEIPENEFKVIHGDQDPEEISKQVISMTADPSFETSQNAKLRNVYSNLVPNKVTQLNNLDKFQAEQLKKAQQRSKEIEKQKHEEIDLTGEMLSNNKSNEDWSEYEL